MRRSTSSYVALLVAMASAFVGSTEASMTQPPPFDFESGRRTADDANCASMAPPLILKGKKFFNSITGEYVPIKGVDYYPRPNEGELVNSNSMDFFSEEFRSIWERDIEHFKSLNINAVRLYAVNPGKFHGSFMCALKKAGMYVIVGLAADCFECAIGKEAAPACYPASLKERGQFIIHQFSKYDNVLAFSAGNEVGLVVPNPEINGPEFNGPCQKKFIRDMRAYIQGCPDMRQIPVGVVVADIERTAKALYYACRSDPQDELENAEFFGLNTYVHCDGSAEVVDDLIGYRVLLEDFQSFGLNIPVMNTEYGCLSNSFPTINEFEAQRTWLQAEALFTPKFREEFAGGFVFEYSTEAVFASSPWPFKSMGKGNYGLGYFAPENCDGNETACVYIPYPQFDLLAQKYGAVDTSDELLMDDYVARSNPIPECPAEFPPLSSFTWAADSAADFKCPTPIAVYCQDIDPSCTIVPANIPPPTEGPTTAPVPPPTLEPVSTPVRPPVTPPVTSPVAPTIPPVVPMSPPVTSPVTSPVAPPVASPVASPMASVVDNPVDAPAALPIDDVNIIPDSAPTSSPVPGLDDGAAADGSGTDDSPVDSVVDSPADSPVALPVDGVDVIPDSAPTTSPVPELDDGSASAGSGVDELASTGRRTFMSLGVLLICLVVGAL